MANCEIKSYNMVRAKIFGKKPTPMQWLIARRSSPQIHSEFRFSKRYDRVSFSATMQDDCKCARFKQIKYSHERERWDTVVMPLTDEQEDAAYWQAKKDEGTPYDLVGQLCHISDMKIWKPNKKKIWCSTQVGKLFYAASVGFGSFLLELDPHLIFEIMPNELDMLARYYFEQNR